MSEATDLNMDAGYVEADLNYIVDDGIPSVRYVDWPEEEHKAHIPDYEAHRVQIRNGRTAGEDFTLPSHGFRLVPHPTQVQSFLDEDEIKRVYYPEIEALIKAESGARRVLVFDHTVRTPDTGQHAEGWVRNTVSYVHNDYTETSAPQRVRDLLPPDEAEAALGRRSFRYGARSRRA
jgi:hypothetical protein